LEIFASIEKCLRLFTETEQMSTKEKPNPKILIPIIGGTRYDISKFDFSGFGIRIWDIESEELKKFIASLNPSMERYNNSFLNDIIEENRVLGRKNYAIVKLDCLSNFSFSEVKDVFRFLLMLFPSDLNIDHVLNGLYEDGVFQIPSVTKYDKRDTGEYGDMLFSHDDYLPEINQFISKYFGNLKELPSYINLALEGYITSFYTSHVQFQYLNLCMCLESVLEGDQEVNYRLRRAIAILCGTNVESCRNIYDNMNKLYGVRSKIIHGEVFNYTAINTYLPGLKAVVSRVLIELVIHNIASRSDLNNKINEVGFGDRNKISSHWTFYRLNVITEVEATLRKLEKVK
jgi:hypothetical protein